MSLNPQLLEILRCAFERQVALRADDGANLDFAREELLEGLVKYRFRGITCPIDGAAPESYTRYRARGDLEQVPGNIGKINEYKKRRGSGFPILTWQFVVFGHNEDEIGMARRMAAGLSMRFCAKIGWDEEFLPIRNPELVRIRTGCAAVTRGEFLQQNGVDYARSICHQSWRSRTINRNGKLLGCCRNFWGDFGANVFRDGLSAGINGEKIAYAQNILTGAAAPLEDIPRATCELYVTMAGSRRWLTRAELDNALQPPGILVSSAIQPRRPDLPAGRVFVSPGGAAPRVETLLTERQYAELAGQAARGSM